MPRSNIGYFVCVAVLAGLSFFRIAMPFAYHVDEEKDPLFATFPMQLGEWAGQDVEVDKRTYDILETRNVLNRKYTNPEGESVFLLLVSSSRDRRVAHPPEVCYLGADFYIMDQREKEISFPGGVLPVKQFAAKSERFADHAQEVLYLYKVGDQYTANYYSQQLKFAWNQVSKDDSKIFLIRLSAVKGDHFEEILKNVVANIP